MILYVFAALAVLISLLLTVAAGYLSSSLQGTSLLLVRVLVVLLGLAGAGVLFWLAQKRKQKPKDAKGEAIDTSAVDDLLREADSKLAASPQAAVKHLRDLPLLYVLGESGSAKTTIVTKSGLEPELLAGQVYRDRNVVPTQTANVWFSGSNALVEAGEAIRKTPELWKRLVTATRPGSFRSATKGAPFRAAVVCVSCEQFMGAQTGEAMQGAAAPLNAQLRELAKQLGAPVPVYVLLTKLDRVPGFTEYVRNLTPEEGQVLLGATPPRTGSGTEQAIAAITDSVDSLLFSMGTARLDLLARETDTQQLAPAYQFPRELRRFRNLLGTYLAELVKPSHLASNPYLRAFCLTGVRPVIVQQVASAPNVATPSAKAASDATGVFQVPQAAAPAPLASPSVYGEKIAQWAFLSRFFPEVVLGDKAALGTTRQTGSGRLLRRLVYGSIAALLLIYVSLLTGSYFANAGLQERLNAASAKLAAAPSGGPLTTEQLTALEQLRGGVVQLEDYRDHGAPLSYRWGLYRGNLLLQPARALYFQHFRALLLTRTQQQIVTGLNGLAATPAANADYNSTYSALRAYLITTANPEKSTVDFLSPVLLQHLQASGAATGAEDRALAQKQFDYYAGVLPTGNPYSIAPAGAAVAKARAYLAAFGGFERIYQGMVNAAEKDSPAIHFTTQYPNAAGVVDEPHTIPGAYTQAGYNAMQTMLAHPDRYFSGEAWVLGEQAPQSIDTAALKGQLATRYVADYLSQWRAFVKDASVVRYADMQDAGKKLTVLSKNDSPLLALFYVVSKNTAVPNPEISGAFQAPQSVVPPGNADQYIGTSNKAYVDSLLALTAAVNQAAAGGADPAAAVPVNTAAAAAHLAAQQAAQGFHIDAKAHLDTASLELLEEPITQASALVRGLGPAQANAGGKGFCSAYSGLIAKAPFNPRVAAQAAPSDLNAVFQPGTGSLWQFYNTNLKTLVVQQGSEYVTAPNAPMQVNPAFLKFFNRMAQLSQELFPPGAKDATFSFTMRPLPASGVQSSVLKMDAQSLSNTDAQKQFLWNAATAKEAGLTANNLPLTFSGPWAIFQLLSKARTQKSPAGYELSFPLELANTPVKGPDGTPVVVRYELSGPGADVLVPGALAGTHCVSEVAK